MWNYARLASTDLEEPLGVYEDEESRAQRSSEEDERLWGRCPNWLTDSIPEFSLQERILGCATCMICGYLLSIGSLMRMKDLMVGNPVPLVSTVTFGNIISLCGTFFLAGPRSQVRRMFHSSRQNASFMYLGSLAATFLLLLMARFPGHRLILLILLISQYASITWYTLSYIPFGREMLKKCCRRMMASSADIDE